MEVFSQTIQIYNPQAYNPIFAGHAQMPESKWAGFQLFFIFDAFECN